MPIFERILLNITTRSNLFYSLPQDSALLYLLVVNNR